MSYTKRDYRTHLSAQGMIFLDGKDFDCTIVDISTSGAKIEIKPGQYFKNSMVLAEIINVGDVTAFFNKEMHFDGTIEIVRKELINNILYVSLIFSDIFYGLEHLSYRRGHYRQECRSAGHIMLNEEIYEVVSLNLSHSGMKIILFEAFEINVKDEIIVNFKHLNVQGKAVVIWYSEEVEHRLIGVEFTQMTKLNENIPSFSLS